MRASRMFLPIVFAVLLAPSSHAAVLSCGGVQMTMTASAADEADFEGLYKYTLSGSWDAGLSGLSRLEITLALGDCICACDPDVLKFTTPAGTAAGEDQNAHACQVGYAGSTLCKRAQSTSPEVQIPTVEFDAASSGCRVSTAGTGTWFFYSPFPPAPPATHDNLVVVKSESLICSASLTGQVPICRCTTPVQPSTWGRMKALYH